MKRMGFFGSVWVLATVLAASQLHYYSDVIHYSPDSPDRFVGFDASIRMECDRSPVPLVAKRQAPTGCSLCATYNGLTDAKTALAGIETETRILEKTMEQGAYKNAEADLILSNASALAGRFSALQQEREGLKTRITAAERLFAQAGQRPDASPLYAAMPCQDPTIIIPSYKLRITPYYDAVLDQEQKSITVTERLAFQNQSGVDIDAKTGVFHTFPLHEHMRRLNFVPWVINERQAPPVPMRGKMAIADEAALTGATMQAPKEAIAVERLSSKRYALSNLHLPADGSKVSVAAQTWQLAASAERIVYPYLDRRVYMTYAFEPASRILADKWQIKSGENYQENAFGVYEQNRYRLYAFIDRDVGVERKKDLHSDSESFFSGSKIEDGYTLTFTNRSNEAKTLQVTERVPVATTDKIEVANVRIDPSWIRFKKDGEGKIMFTLTLDPEAVQKVHIGFTVKHDKETPVVY